MNNFCKGSKCFLLRSFNIVLIASSFLWFFHPPNISQAAVIIRFRFDEHLCDAYWTSSSPSSSLNILPCPGTDSDSQGFVRMIPETNKLEDGSWAERTFETHPKWQTDGWILGTFSLYGIGVTLETGDHLVGQAGLMQGAGAGQVRFTIQYDQNPYEPGGEVKLFENEDTYDGKLLDFDIDLSSYAGQNGDFLLQVNALGAASQDWAVWNQVRIQQTSTIPIVTSTGTTTQTRTVFFPPTNTATPTLTPTSTVTITPTYTGTATPTITPTITPTLVATEPPPPVETRKPCACFESQVLDIFFSGNDGFAVGNFISGQGLVLLTVVDEKAAGDKGLFTMYDPQGNVLRSFEARFTPNDVIAVGDVWGDESEDEILVGIDEDHRVYVYNSSGTLLETKLIPYSRYDILAVGNVISDYVSPGDELIFASDGKSDFLLYQRSGSFTSIPIDWDFDGNSVPGMKSDAHNDALVTGNVLGSDEEEILFIDNKNSDKSILYIYSGDGTLLAKTQVRYTKFDNLASGNVMGGKFDEVVIGIDEDRAIYILNALTGVLKLFQGRVTGMDVLALGDSADDGKEDIFLAVDEDHKIYIYLQE